MKKIGMGFILAMLLYTIPVYSQTIKVRSLRGDNKIESIKKLRFDDSEIILENVQVNCDEIEFSDKVKKITLKGYSILICKKVTVSGTPTPIDLVTKSGGQLKIEYSDQFSNQLEFVIDKSTGVTISIAHKPM